MKIIKTLFMDISAYQPSDLNWFREKWSQGFRGVVVKVTEGDETGTNYVSPKWVEQVNNALTVGFQVGVYHFARYSSVENAKSEARFFLNQVNQYGFDNTTVCMVDCETNDYGLDAGTYQTATNAWLDVVRRYYPKVSVYASYSWWTSGMLNSHNIGDAIAWVAGYDVDDLGIDNAGAWQFDNGTRYGYGVDSNYDFTGAFTSPQTPVEPQSPNGGDPKVITLKSGEKVVIQSE